MNNKHKLKRNSMSKSSSRNSIKTYSRSQKRNSKRNKKSLKISRKRSKTRVLSPKRVTFTIPDVYTPYKMQKTEIEPVKSVQKTEIEPIKSLIEPIKMNDKIDIEPIKTIQKIESEVNKQLNFALCVTHNGRLKLIMRKFLEIIKPDIQDDNYLNLVNNTKSFKNCAIIHMTSTFIEVFNNETRNVFYTYSKSCNLLQNLEIVFVRHGQGFHNIHSGFSKLTHFFEKDPKLTPLGIEQANTAGKIISKEIIQNRIGMNYILMASELSRTQQTISEIIPYIKNIDNKPVYIINCIFEIGDIPGTSIIPENTPTCNRKSYMNKTEKNNCNEVKNKSGNVYNLLWLEPNKYDCWNEVFQSVLYDINLILENKAIIINRI